MQSWIEMSRRDECAKPFFSWKECAFCLIVLWSSQKGVCCNVCRQKSSLGKIVVVLGTYTNIVVVVGEILEVLLHTHGYELVVVQYI